MKTGRAAVDALLQMFRAPGTDMCLGYLCREEQDFWRAFDFLPQWGMLSHSDKLARLRDYACHELHYFVQQRDPELFQSAVLPLLQVRCGCCCVPGCGYKLIPCSDATAAVPGFVTCLLSLSACHLPGPELRHTVLIVLIGAHM